MTRGLESIVIYTKNPDELAKFYTEKVGLKKESEAEGGEGSKMYVLKAEEGPNIYISNPGSDGVSYSVVPNIEVDDIEKEAEKLVNAGTKQTIDIFHLEGYGLISEFEDPGGNKFNLVQVREN